MNNDYKGTVRACFVGYVVQAVVNTFAPLLFLFFSTAFGLSIEKITILTTVNFLLQLTIDFSSAFFIDKIGYRMTCVIAHVFATVGLVSLAILPYILQPFSGLLISVALYAIGGGLIEVVISPVVESCPGDDKDKRMSLLHSFYCWGSVAVIGISSLYFYLFGVENWRILALLWAVLPLVNGIIFAFVPFCPLVKDGDEKLPVTEVLKNKTFIILAVIILCSGATEAAIVQWSSAFAENTLGLNKTLGDLLCPMAFAAAMGFSRLLYGKSNGSKDLRFAMILGAFGCVTAYLLLSLVHIDFVCVAAMILCGFSVGILWPGTYSLASKKLKNGGSAVFSFLALAGDFGCMAGPYILGEVTSVTGGNFYYGILAAAIFPIILAVFLFFLKKDNKTPENSLLKK